MAGTTRLAPHSSRRRAVMAAASLVLLLVGLPPSAAPLQANPTPVRVSPAPVPGSPAAATYRIGTFNMAGGNSKYGTAGDEAADDFVRTIKEREPAFVTIQEGCRDWTERLDSRLPGYSAVFDTVVPEVGTPARCWHDSEFGNAILYRDDLGFTPPTGGGHDLGSPAGREQREMLCVRSQTRRLAVCTIHMSSGSAPKLQEARRTEAAEAKRLLSTTYRGYKKFLMGDINTTPDAAPTDSFYHRGYGDGATGEFKEADSPCGNDMNNWTVPCRAGEATFGLNKIDYLFVPPSVTVNRAETVHSDYSDHDSLWAEVVL
ncbi:endonuclease/exonuclease/phosphatase family protein [Streptomyces sp. HC44]|uniref:Endonuclease/exonuclease/phosphatase family protein n=1 Tax=Streptomyces scabichelini TaxID=2711217 RepID=A0A6G4VFN1_9ACTN|nr:endonuclease/exonuclease/phosphatase family protein [Streptomyces scabichelini]NGO12630.1 endonuclease/exonuclease/phosphatase family protein [Streptomyces scabichelini]